MSDRSPIRYPVQGKPGYRWHGAPISVTTGSRRRVNFAAFEGRLEKTNFSSPVRCSASGSDSTRHSTSRPSASGGRFALASRTTASRCRLSRTISVLPVCARFSRSTASCCVRALRAARPTGRHAQLERRFGLAESTSTGPLRPGEGASGRELSILSQGLPRSSGEEAKLAAKSTVDR
jgi:hypothetical protein